MDRKHKEDIIFKEISRKDLTFGCLVKCRKSIVIFLRMEKEGTATCLRKNNKIVGIIGFNKKNILGHEITLDDILLRVKKQGWNMVVSNYGKVLFNKQGTTEENGSYREFVRKLGKRLPEQTNETVDILYDLIPKVKVNE